MAVIRVEKNKNYTCMSNYHLKDKNLSLKAIGLLSKILSLPNDWDYSINGLVAICKENETAIKSTLKELQENGYLEVTKHLPNQTTTGRFEYEYTVYEQPKQEDKKQGVENLPLEILSIENHTQLNTKELNTKELNTNYNNIPPCETNVSSGSHKHKYGEYKNVLLKDDELEKLKQEYSNYEDLIKYLDEYIEMKGYKAKSHYLCIKKWVINAVKEKTKKVTQEEHTKTDEERIAEMRARFGGMIDDF